MRSLDSSIVALFLIFRLKNVLGTRDGFEPKVKDGINRKEEVKNPKDLNENNLDEEVTEYLLDDKQSTKALTKIKELEKDFFNNCRKKILKMKKLLILH